MEIGGHVVTDCVEIGIGLRHALRSGEHRCIGQTLRLGPRGHGAAVIDGGAGESQQRQHGECEHQHDITRRCRANPPLPVKMSQRHRFS